MADARRGQPAVPVSSGGPIRAWCPIQTCPSANRSAFQIGARAFSGRYRFFKREYLLRTQAFFERHGGMAVVLSRFAPILRTFAPFVAGIGRMSWSRYSAYNIAGAVSWVSIMTVAGFLFGNLPPVRNNFGLVTVAIILISVTPMFWVLWRDRATVRAGRG